jgi:hypothetical protein
MYVANLGASAFLRTKINLVEWMADLLEFNRGGRGGGRGRPAEVGPPDVGGLVQVNEKCIIMILQSQVASCMCTAGRTCCSLYIV